jgi:ABC-type multidrug transport system fused ATPase/permease subunit
VSVKIGYNRSRTIMSRRAPVLIRVLSFVRPYIGRVLLAWAVVVGSAGFALAMPYLVRYAVNQGIDIVNGQPEGSQATLIKAAMLIVAAALLRGVFQYLQTYVNEWLSQQVAYDIRNRIYDHLQRLSFAYHDKAQTGQIMSRATQDVEGVRLYISMGLLRLIYVLILLFVALTLMFLTSWKLALIATAFIPVVAGRSIQVTIGLRPIWLLVQDLQGRLGTVIQENLSGMRVVKAFAREDEEAAKFEREARALFENGYATNRVQAANTPLLTGIWTLAIVAVAWVGAIEIKNGNLSVGDLSAFALYLNMLGLPVRSLGWIVLLFARGQAAAQRIYEILDAESAVKEKPGAIVLESVKGHVRFENVSFGYDAVSPVLREVDFEAKPGQMVALLGPTGSGKTTIVNLLPRFYDVTGGRITIDGIDIRDVTLASLRRAIGIVQQDVFLFSATIRDNIAYGAVDATQEEIERAARIARIHDFIVSLPDGYDTWVGERGITLSGGQKQRVAIARTLLLNPRILIFDDSTSSVDTETEYLIQQALAELMEGRTTFVIAQRLRTVKRADQILVLKDGRIVERGTHDELIRRDGLYRQIYDLELRDQEEALERLAGEVRVRASLSAGGGS